jgi:hypothetical protein
MVRYDQGSTLNTRPPDYTVRVPEGALLHNCTSLGTRKVD